MPKILLFRLRVASAFGHRDANLPLGGQRPLRRHDRGHRVPARRWRRMVQSRRRRVAWRRCRQLRPVPRIPARLALPPEHELESAESIYQKPQDIRSNGPASVLLGTFGGLSSPLKAPSSINYLAVRLKAGETWRYEPPTDHTICWIALASGRLAVPEPAKAGELVAFETSKSGDRLPGGGRHRVRSRLGSKPSL